MTQSKNQSRSESHGKQGFASMPKDKVKEIASKGGSSSHRGSSSGSQNEGSGNRSSGKQGFASMSKDKVKEIASKGGQSHGSNR